MTSLTEIVGVVLPLLAIAGSAVAYVVKFYSERSDIREQRFTALVSRIDEPGAMASKVAAVYEMRQFPEHRDFIVRFCRTQQGNVSGSGAALLEAEMQQTAEYFRRT